MAHTPRLRVLIIDDAPGRYDEFCRLLDEKGYTWVITCDPDFVQTIQQTDVDAILLDHDMPYRTGVVWAQWLITHLTPLPIIVTSTTRVPQAREQMKEALDRAKFPCFIVPADTHHCELEWLALLRGALRGLACQKD